MICLCWSGAQGEATTSSKSIIWDFSSDSWFCNSLFWLSSSSHFLIQQFLSSWMASYLRSSRSKYSFFFLRLSWAEICKIFQMVKMLTGETEKFLPYFLSFVVSSSEIFPLLYSVEASWVLNNPLILGSSFPHLLEIILHHLTPKNKSVCHRNSCFSRGKWRCCGIEIELHRAVGCEM